MKLTYKQFWFQWLMYCGFGEMLSIAVAATIAVSFNYAVGSPIDFASGALFFAVMMASGAVQGIILALMQWTVLRLKYNTLRVWEWMGYT